MLLLAVLMAFLQLTTKGGMGTIHIKHPCERFPIQYKSKLQNATYTIGGIFPVHSKKEGKYIYNKAGLTWIEAMTFALEEINNRTDLLPNITLGFNIFDSCNDIGIAVEASLQLTQGFVKYSDNMTCPCKPSTGNVIGIVGDASSATTTRVAALTAATKTTQISYSATSTDLSAKHLYPSFLRTIPPDDFQANLITDLLRHYHWKYINIVACDDNYGRVGVSELLPQLKHFNICVAINEMYDVKNDIDSVYTKEVVQKLKNEKEATVTILWCQLHEAMKFLQAAQTLKLYHRTWIATESYGRSENLYKIDHNVVKGMFGIIPAQLSYAPFEAKLRSIKPNVSDDNPWLEQYWTEEKNCKRYGSATYVCNTNTNVSSPIDLRELPKNKYVNVIDSVYAIAHGLQDYINDKGNRLLKPKDLLPYVKNVSFVGKSNVQVMFNNFGNPGIATYSITNLQYDPTTDQLQHVEVGFWNYLKRNITFTRTLEFTNGSGNSPTSSCAALCLPGQKGLTFGDRPCCWKCVRCPIGEIQPDYGKSHCHKCKDETLPNRNQTRCIEPEIQSLDEGTAEGGALIFLMAIGYILIITCLVIACIHRSTPIVKAANKRLSLLQLVSMLFIYALPAWSYQSKPTVLLCGLRLYYFVGFYSVAVSVTFTKADRLLRIFKASKSGILAKRSNIKSNKVQYLTVLMLTFVSLVICSVIFIFRPVIEKEVKYVGNDNIHVWYYCSGYHDSMLFILIGYIAVIALICGVYAFKARKLPETHNEARYTSFAMFTFLLIWMMFAPIYFSTTAKVDRVTRWCYISFASTFALYATMYLPKLYIILFKPDQNTTKQFRAKMRGDAIPNIQSEISGSSNSNEMKYVIQ